MILNSSFERPHIMLRLYDFCERPVVNLLRATVLTLHALRTGGHGIRRSQEKRQIGHKTRLLKEARDQVRRFQWGSIGREDDPDHQARRKAEGKRAEGIAIAGDVTGDDDFARMKKSGMDAVNCNTAPSASDANVAKALER